MPPDEIMYPFGEISRLFLPSEETKEWNTLLLDDVQLMRQENDQQALCALIRDCPDRRFWLLSRGLIPSWLTPFQVEGGLTVITAQDLRMDRESTGLLLQAYGVTVSDVKLTAIYEETHGYALAVTLLACRMAQGQRYDRTTSDEIRRDLFLYYEEAVFNRLDLSAQRLLLDLSPFETVNNELARIVSGNNCAGELMGGLVRESNMLLQDALGSYHFWPIFRQFLIWELEQRRSREYCQVLYNRGGLYYELNEDYGRALECYSRGGNHCKITELLIRNAEMHPGMGHYLEMEPYYRALPEDEILNSPALMQAMSMLCAMRMDYDGSQRWYDALQEYIETKRGGAAQVKEARGRLAWLDIGLPQRKVEATAELFPTVFRLLTSRELRLPPFSVTSALPSLMNGGKDFSPWSKQDDLLYATLCRPVEAVLGRDGVCLGDCALAESKFEKGEDIRDRGMSLLQNLDRIRRDGTPDIEFAVVGLLARMQMHLGRAQEAKDGLEMLRQRFVQTKQTRFLPNLDALLCRVDLLLGNDTQVGLWYRDKAPKNPADVQIIKRYQYFTQAMVQLSFGHEDGALATLAPLESFCQACRRYIDTIHLQVLRAIATYRLGCESWRAFLCAGLDIAWEYSFVRPISQYGAAVLPLLQECGWNQDPAFFEAVVSAVRGQAAFYPDYLSPRPEMTAPLSGTEQQVLHLLCAGKSNAEICEVLGVKLATVKTHISHIFDKLNVRRRSEVKEAARRLHLIS